MKRILPALLIAAALLVGLFLPSAVLRLGDDRSRDEQPDIRQVDLSVSSGLDPAQKLRLLSEPEAEVSVIGLGRYQDAESLSAASWALFTELRLHYRLFEYETLTQTSQQALLISGGSSAFVCWEVCFDDGAGAHLRLLIDDETALPLSVQVGLPFETEPEEMQEYALCTLYAMLFTDAAGVNTVYSPELADPKQPDGEEFVLHAELIDTETGEAFPIPVACSPRGFRINAPAEP